MILYVDSDAAYLCAPDAKSRIVGYYYLTSLLRHDTLLSHNTPIYVMCKLLKHTVASAAEAETTGLFFNAQEIIHICRILESLGHPQPPTPLNTDNSTASAFVNNMMKLKKSKSWEMRTYWLHDAPQRKQIDIIWDKESNNKRDYFTKHHPSHHHQKMQELLFHQPS